MQTIVDEVKRSLGEQHSSLSWQQVTMPGLSVAWVGLHVPMVDTGGRPWVWEVVTPDQYEKSERLQSDPLVLSVPHDVVIVEMTHPNASYPDLRMQVPVTTVPESVVLPRSISNAQPWSIRLETGWTAQTLAAAAQLWIDREVPGQPRLQVPAEPVSPPQLYQLHPAINIESAAFDHLLTLKPREAAVVTSVLATVHDALQPYR